MVQTALPAVRHLPSAVPVVVKLVHAPKKSSSSSLSSLCRPEPTSTTTSSTSSLSALDVVQIKSLSSLSLLSPFRHVAVCVLDIVHVRVLVVVIPVMFLMSLFITSWLSVSRGSGQLVGMTTPLSLGRRHTNATKLTWASIGDDDASFT